MSLTIATVPCLQDNYAYLARDESTGTTALIDAPEAAPILAELAERGWGLDLILITHHHGDHIDGVARIREETGAKVVGATADARRLPPLDMQVSEGDTVSIGDTEGVVLDVSGHTVGHIAYHFPGAKAAFTADSLMALGCGRVFEGTMPMMWQSLSKLAALPGDTRIYSGHEYTAANLRFALTIEPGNARLQTRGKYIEETRAAGQPTVPVTLSEELATNPFLRAAQPEVKAAVGMPGAPDAEVFAEVRKRKDNF